MLNDLIVGRAALAPHPASRGEAPHPVAPHRARPRLGPLFRRRLRGALRRLRRLASG